MSVAFTPIQSLHGYDKPWAGGAGKNKAELNSGFTTFTKNGITWTNKGNGVIHAQGTAIEDAFCTELWIKLFKAVVEAGTYRISVDSTNVRLRLGKGADSTYVSTDIISGTTYTLGSDDILYVGVFVKSGTTLNTDLHIQIEQGSSTTAWEPYSNVCPISGRTAVTITDYDSDSNTTSVTIQLGQTVYGGTLDVKTGMLTVTDGYIASYNGETLPSTWISDRDVYAAGTTPSIGAEVCYKLATPTTVQLTANELEMFKGYNSVTTDSGDTITITAYVKTTT